MRVSESKKLIETKEQLVQEQKMQMFTVSRPTKG